MTLERKPFSTLLHGRRISLRACCPTHATEVWHSIQRDHEAGGKNYAWIQTLEEVEKYITSPVVPASNEFNYLIFSHETVIGFFHIHTISYADHKSEIGLASIT
jgi:hypothetical protein